MLGTHCTAVRVCGLKAKVLCRALLQSLAGHSNRQQGTVAMLLGFVRCQIRKLSVTHGMSAIPSERLELCPCTAELLMYCLESALTSD